jgi:hypothetical protein
MPPKQTKTVTKKITKKISQRGGANNIINKSGNKISFPQGFELEKNGDYNVIYQYDEEQVKKNKIVANVENFNIIIGTTLKNMRNVPTTEPLRTFYNMDPEGMKKIVEFLNDMKI